GVRLSQGAPSNLLIPKDLIRRLSRWANLGLPRQGRRQSNPPLGAFIAASPQHHECPLHRGMPSTPPRCGTQKPPLGEAGPPPSRGTRGHPACRLKHAQTAEYHPGEDEPLAAHD